MAAQGLTGGKDLITGLALEVRNVFRPFTDNLQVELPPHVDELGLHLRLRFSDHLAKFPLRLRLYSLNEIRVRTL